MQRFQASHSRAPVAVGVVRLEPVILDRVSLSHHVPVSRFYIAQTFQNGRVPARQVALLDLTWSDTLGKATVMSPIKVSGRPSAEEDLRASVARLDGWQ